MAFNYDKLVDACFIPGPNGRVAYYPWGTALRGYWVDSEMRRVTLRVATRQLYRVMRLWIPVMFIGPPMLGSFVSSRASLTFLVLGVAGLFFWWLGTIRRLAGSLERAPRLGWKTDFIRFEKIATRYSYQSLVGSVAFLSFLEFYAAHDLVQSGRDVVQLGGNLVICLANALFVATLVVKLWKRIPTHKPTPEEKFVTAAMKPVWIWLALLFALSLFLVFNMTPQHG